MSPRRQAVTNAGPLMVLAKLQVPFLLARLYTTVHIPLSVYEEVVVQGLRHGYEDARVIRTFLEEMGWTPEPVSLEEMPPALRTAPLDRGERDTLALALNLGECVVLMDEHRGRLVARQLGLPVRGSLGILVQAYRKGLLEEEQLRWYLIELEQRPDIWISPRLIRRVREEIFGER